MTVDAKELAEKLRKARRLDIPVNSWRFAARRPTDLELSKLSRLDANTGELALRYVDGWTGVTVGDVLGTDDAAAAPFSSELWEEFIADRPDVYGPVGIAIMDAYNAHATTQEEARKN